ncbi:hypothetical protein MFRU_002g04590 [Monilinia fructicola]|nr:hypothetical protein MFRU_002g04590 [Monilinia fructicola]
MIKKRDDNLVATAVVIPQTSDHSINPNKTSNQVTFDTPVTSLIVDKEEIDLHGSNPPYPTGGELDAKPDDTRMLATSDLTRHYFSEGRREQKGVDLCGGLTPPCANVQSRETSAAREDREEVKSEEVDDSHHAIPLRPMGSVANGEQESYGASTSSTTSPHASGMHFAPALSSANDDKANDMKEALIHLLINSLPPPRIHHTFATPPQRNNPTPSPRLAPQQSPPSHPPARSTPHHAPRPPPLTSPPPPNTPKHEIFLHTLPPRTASVPHVRAWIASWFLGRDLALALAPPRHRHGRDIDIDIDIDPAMQQYVACISWSGHDVHDARTRSLERDLRGWMLDGYARAIARDIARAVEMARARERARLARRGADFLWGAALVAVLGLLCLLLWPCSCGGLRA